MLTEHLQTKAFIAPPQIYELSRLANFRQYEELKNFSMHREQFGIERWTYYVNGLADGALLALPGEFFFLKECMQPILLGNSANDGFPKENYENNTWIKV